MRIRTKIALTFTLMTAAILFAVSSFVYVVSLSHAREFFFTRLQVRASIAAESFKENGNNEARELRDRHLQRLPREQEFFFTDERALSKNIGAKLPGIPVSFVDELIGQGAAEAHNGFQHYIGRRHEASDQSGKRFFVVATAYDESGAENLVFLRNMLLVGVSIATLLVFALGQIFANRIMRPIAQIISKVHDITTTNLSERLPEMNGKDEIAEMALTFNSMLDRLETTFELQRNFIGNASHELNTPLTAIMGETEIVLQAPRTTDEYVESLNVIQHEARKLHDVTSSLLKLSSISYEGKKQKIELLHLDELLMEVKISLDRRMPANKVKILIQNNENRPNGFSLVGSSIWLELAVTNVVQNSIKYSDNKEVLVTLSSDDTHAFIEISDQGIGIPDDDMRYVFEPFFRARNTSPYKGYGIGLPLAARIVKLHAGELKIYSKPNIGTKVTLQFAHQ